MASRFDDPAPPPVEEEEEDDDGARAGKTWMTADLPTHPVAKN